jgi:hypothetical protein
MNPEAEPNKSNESESVWQQLDTLLTNAQTRPTPLTPQEVVSSIDAVVQDAERIRVRQQRQRRLFVVSMTLVFALGFIAIVYNVLVEGLKHGAEDLKQGMNEMIADHPVTYTMPAAAQIIDEYTSLADWFGDFEYCATFRVPDAEYDWLLQNGLNWIYMGQGSTTPTPHEPVWKGGRLSGSGFSLSSRCFARLSVSPTSSQEYRYLIDDEPDFVRLLAIDEKSKIIYYYRGSW